MMYDALPPALPALYVAIASNRCIVIAELLYITTPDHPFWAVSRAFKFFATENHDAHGQS
jgi:hypothetical protein